ncbi:MAG TPA: hypothetical protein VFJ07_15210 [Streptosporangiaceae bacterium]|nr:hypothetical protein [Streptosporangiaceae bacterium]
MPELHGSSARRTPLPWPTTPEGDRDEADRRTPHPARVYNYWLGGAGVAGAPNGGNFLLGKANTETATASLSSTAGISEHLEAFVVNETNGTWRTAQEVPGTAALNKGGVARVWSVSCASAGHCSAGGIYTDSAGHQQAFVVTET